MALRQFLCRTPNLANLFLFQCPVALWEFPRLKAVTFATGFAPGIVPSILDQFPRLRNLYLRDCHVMSLRGRLPRRPNLRQIRFDSSHQNASSHLTRALNICADVVQDLDIRFIGGLLMPAPALHCPPTALTPKAAQNLINLRLDNISVLSHPSSTYAQVLRNLPVLQNLHLSRHASFALSAFSALPPSLRRLSASKYYGLWERAPEQDEQDFIVALSKCISASPCPISRILASEGIARDDNQMILPLGPIISTCVTQEIPFLEIFHDDEPYIQIFCASFLVAY